MGFLDRFRKPIPATPVSPVKAPPRFTPDTVIAVLDRPSPAHTVPLYRGAGPAVQREKIAAGGVSLAKKFDAAGVSLAKRDLTGVRGEAVVLLDHSGSMVRDYENGSVQTLVERALGFALQIDQDGTVPVIRFDSGVYGPVDVTLDNYQGIVNRKLYDRHGMGSTNLTAALHKLLRIASTTNLPIFAVIITDGAPDNQGTATQLIRELSQYPVFIKFLSIRQVTYLETLDTMGGRLVDNVNSQFIGDPAGIGDAAFAEAMVDEWELWITAAQEAGVLV